MNVCNGRDIVVDVNTLEDVDTLMKQLNEEEQLDVDTEDIASFCNRQMGIQFEKKQPFNYTKSKLTRALTLLTTM